MSMYDYLIVGAGLYGAVFAYEMTQRGKKCLVIEKRDHIGGNTYTGVTVADNVYTIKGEDIKGEIVFTVTKTPIPTDSWTVTYEGDKGTLENTTVAKDAAHSFTLTKEPGYVYTVTYKMGTGELLVHSVIIAFRQALNTLPIVYGSL